jgi:hypothetical protein
VVEVVVELDGVTRMSVLVTLAAELSLCDRTPDVTEELAGRGLVALMLDTYPDVLDKNDEGTPSLPVGVVETITVDVALSEDNGVGVGIVRVPEAE